MTVLTADLKEARILERKSVQVLGKLAARDKHKSELVSALPWRRDCSLHLSYERGSDELACTVRPLSSRRAPPRPCQAWPGDPVQGAGQAWAVVAGAGYGWCRAGAAGRAAKVLTGELQGGYGRKCRCMDMGLGCAYFAALPAPRSTR